MAGLGTALQVIGAVEGATKALPEVVRSIQSIVDVLMRCADDVAKSIDFLKKSKVKIGSSSRYAYDVILAVLRQARSFLKETIKLFEAGRSQEHITTIKQQIQTGHHIHLASYIDYLKERLSTTENSYQEYKEPCERAKKTCVAAAEECKLKKNEAETKKKIAQGVGGAAAAGTMAAGIGTGVALSVVAGVFTFGIGTVVGLSLTAAGAAVGGTAIGVGTAVGTHFIAEEFTKLESAFRSASSRLDSSEREIVKLDNDVGNLHCSLERISTDIGIVEKQMQRNEKQMLADALKALWSEFESQYPQIAECDETLASGEQSLRTALDT